MIIIFYLNMMRGLDIRMELNFDINIDHTFDQSLESFCIWILSGVLVGLLN